MIFEEMIEMFSCFKLKQTIIHLECLSDGMGSIIPYLVISELQVLQRLAGLERLVDRNPPAGRGHLRCGGALRRRHRGRGRARHARQGLQSRDARRAGGRSRAQDAGAAGRGRDGAGVLAQVRPEVIARCNQDMEPLLSDFDIVLPRWNSH